MARDLTGTAAHARPDLGGTLLVILSAFCYSTLAIFGKIVLGEGMELPSLLATRFILASALLWLLVLASPKLRREAAAARRRWAGLLLWGVSGLAGQAGLFFGALGFISASLAEVLLYTCPAFLALILWARTRRRPASPVLLAIGLSLAGTWLVAAPAGEPVHLPGVLLGLGAGLWFASWVLVLERVTPGVHPIISTTFVVSGAGLAFAAVLPFTGGWAPPPSAAAWSALLGMVGTATILGFTFFVVGMRRTGPQVASVLSTFEPVGTLLLAGLALGERLRPGQWCGAALVVGAAFALAWPAPVAAGPGVARAAAGVRIDPSPPPA